MARQFKPAVVQILAVFILAYAVAGCTARDDDMDLVLHRIAEIQSLLADLKKQLDSQKSEAQSAASRVSPELAAEFENDEAFLDQVVALKKQKLLAQLEYEISKLEDIATQSSPTNAEANGFAPRYAGSGQDLKVFMINHTTKAALIKLNDEVLRAFPGDQVGGYTISEINRDHIVLGLPSGEEIIKRLVHNAAINDLRVGGELLEREQQESEGESEFSRLLKRK